MRYVITGYGVWLENKAYKIAEGDYIVADEEGIHVIEKEKFYSFMTERWNNYGKERKI